MISSTVKDFGNGIYLNADGLRTDKFGILLSISSIVVTATGISPEGVASHPQGTFIYDSVAQQLWIQPTTGLTAGWVQLI